MKEENHPRAEYKTLIELNPSISQDDILIHFFFVCCTQILRILIKNCEIIYNRRPPLEFSSESGAIMGKIDEIDMKILSELQKDASISVPKLSKKINVNASVAYSRIKRLAKRQLIKKFTIEVNDDALGLSVSALIGLNIDSKYREQILQEMLQMDGIRDVYEVTGRFDLIIKVKAKSLDELHETVSAKMGRLTGVVHTETFIEMRKREREVAYAVQKV